MAEITLKGNTVHTHGLLPTAGTKAPDFRLTKHDLSDVFLSDLADRTRIISISPSLDTSVYREIAGRRHAVVQRYGVEISEEPDYESALAALDA